MNSRVFRLGAAILLLVSGLFVLYSRLVMRDTAHKAAADSSFGSTTNRPELRIAQTNESKSVRPIALDEFTTVKVSPTNFQKNITNLYIVGKPLKDSPMFQIGRQRYLDEQDRIQKLPLEALGAEFKARRQMHGSDRLLHGKRLIQTLKSGMSEEEVLRLLGEPSEGRGTPNEKTSGRWVYHLRLSCFMALDFLDGKLVSFSLVG